MLQGLPRLLVAAAASVVLVTGTGVAQTRVAAAKTPFIAPDALHQNGANVTISLLTMGNGENVWELFGNVSRLVEIQTTPHRSITQQHE
jgi:hypothetical protein